MILKKLTATGFKSFADKTEFDFDRGITCIVGPNGCGKSNVVDAIKWVLGEQSAKSLRGKQMLDVIFNGSGTRKSSGMAQVDLTFDNSDGLLPMDQTDVVVSRRLYRSGESEYLLNKQVCRLKDIRELFLDTGVGLDAYSFIEQGKVDVLLQANPTERRAIFEEAAGINKYKVRKKEALRRLERVDQNLLRVQDIVEEVEKRLRSVKLAAGKARNYQSYMQRLRELRSQYALAEYHRLRASKNELEQKTTELSDRVTQIRTDLSNNEAKTSEANVRIVDLERETQEIESRLLTVQSQITAHEERIAASERRIADQEALLERSRERLAGFDAQVQSLNDRLTAQQEEANSIESDLATVQEEQSRHQQDDTACAHELNEKKNQLDDAKENVIELVRRTSQLHNEIQGISLQREAMALQKKKLDDRDAEIARDLEQVVARQGDLEVKRDELNRVIEEKTREQEETKNRIAEAAKHRATLLEQVAAAKEYRSGLESRQDLLADMDRKHEGLHAGAREILELRDADESRQTFSYVLGAVGELFETDVSHASIVEAVLGRLETNLVVTQRDRLLADRDKLEELTGRVQSFCLDATPAPIGGPDLSGQEGFVANLLDWVQYPAECERLARHLIGRTYVVETSEAALRMTSLDPHGRFVTMGGVVLESDGSLGLGALGASAGLITRRSELRGLAKELEEVAERIERLTDELQQSESKVDQLEARQHELRGAIYDANTDRVETQAALSSVEDTVRQLSEERPLIASEVAVLVSRLQELEEQETSTNQTLSVVEQRHKDAEQQTGQLRTEIDGLTSKRDAIAEKITAARVRVGELSQRRSSVAEAMRELQAAKIQLDADREKANRDVVEAQERIDQSHRQIAEARSTLEQLNNENAELSGKNTSIRQERENLREAVDQYAHEAKQLRGDLEQVETELHEQQMKLQEVRVRVEDLVARIAEELSVDLEEQYKDYQPDEEQDWPAVEGEIDQLRQKIERLGNVNLDAIREQDELETRLEFLTNQLNDLRASERQLQTLIDKLNTESEQRFLETFRAVQGHFSALFKKLFGGGKAELSLMDENDVLECGIEVMARPPGKELQSISLLSGGEKTMTAIALLMAVFRSRPSPFVLLDEVDAALDEANNVRFNNVVREFVELSQFIVITHSKRTMSMADVMYGVTMQEAGVSKRVSVRFEEDPPKSAVA
ncbi:MAG: chromosome segregation protein SMC [Phycisphaerales bacterium]|nr:chromosome segregation protein SMC [Phycisphaerales bacterium]